MYRTIKEIKQANKEAGQHWFDADTMRFFNSRILSPVIGGRYFVSSEKYDDGSPRLYTIRIANDDGTIDTVGDFQGYETADKAKRAAWRKSQQAAYAS